MSLPPDSIEIGLVLERRKPVNPWAEHAWLPHAALAEAPAAAAWTPLGGNDSAEQFYAGPAIIRFHRGETANYRDNLATGAPKLWVALRPKGFDPPVEVVVVTADPAEGEAHTEAGSTVVDQLAMPENVARALAAYVAEHHVEQEFHKRQRKRYDPEQMAKRPGGRKGSEDAQ